jgi:tRNA pseudouridine55 synthase
MDMVRMAKRISRVKHVGHAGTLDPIATGVLPICFGSATRLMEYLVDGRKIYRAEFTMGAATDTYDAVGTETHTGDWSSVTREDVEALFPSFTGVIMQQPPMYSALKHEGQRLYDLARAGIEVDRADREVTVYALTLTDWSPPTMSIEVECGRGFYMRTFGHDLGIALGCYAYLSELARTKAGVFTLEDLVTPEAFEEAGEQGTWRELLVPTDAAVRGLDPLTLQDAAERHMRNGQPVTVPSAGVYSRHLELRRAYSGDGRFLGLLRFNRPEAMWQPEKVFAIDEPSRFAPTAG